MEDIYLRLKEEFDSVRDNNQLLRDWFLRHEYLDIQDLCNIIGKCSREVRALKRSTGIKGKPPRVKRRANNRTLDLAELPENWKTKEWLLDNLHVYGSNAILRASGMPLRSFYNLLLRYNIKRPGKIIKNPCCSKSWCHQHYIILGLSARKCATLAGVTHPTFVDWLIKFKIPKRASTKRFIVPVMVKHLMAKLKRQEVVQNVILHPNHLQVVYRNGLISRYNYSLIKGDQWYLDNIPSIVYEYEDDLATGDKYPAHIAIPKFGNCTIFERDIAILTFMDRLTKRGWIQPKAPINVLENELSIMKNIKENNYYKNGIFTTMHDKLVTKYIMLHYFEHNYFWDYLNKPKLMFKLCKSLLKSKYKFNFYNIIKSITSKRSKYRFPNPVLYSVIFNKLGFKGSILDLHLGTGARAIASALSGCEYLYDTPRFTKAINDGFADFVNLRCRQYNNDTVDLVICDNDLSHSDVEYALSYADRAKNIMIYVPREYKEEYFKRYNPRSMIKIINHPINRDPNYFFIW